MNEKLSKIINSSDNIVFFGGAGVSTESGIPDFRSADGLYNQKYKYPPETILSRRFLDNEPEIFFGFYREKMIYRDAKPNKAHYALAALEKSGKLKEIITQNIDGLHQMAGSVNVLELHGSVNRNYCAECGAKYGLDAITASAGVPKCACGGVIRPDVVLYGEFLATEVMERAARYVSRADTLIIGGTSLSVYPAAGIVNYFSGRSLVLINKTETSADGLASLVIREPIGEAMG